MSTKPQLKYFPFDPTWVIYQDEDILVVNKPSGLLSVPGKDVDSEWCLVGQCEKFLGPTLTVHRLDMDTSGIMVLAKTKLAQRHLSLQFEMRQTQKHYHALVFGILELSHGEIHLPMRCDWINRPKQMVDFIHGKHASTLWEIESTYPERNASLIKLTPITGRSHQLRLHMKMLGHPILGDNLYADKKGIQMASRLCLHATSLTFKHPTTELAMNFNQPICFLKHLNNNMA